MSVDFVPNILLPLAYSIELVTDVTFNFVTVIVAAVTSPNVTLLLLLNANWPPLLN